jgi:hypothetical protein
MIGCYVLSWYMVYQVKLNFKSWKDDVNYVRVWFFIEVNYIFAFIIASCIFTMGAQVFKFKSSLKSDEDLHHDDNIWNDRESSDFLRYIKYDYFVFVYIITSALLNY